MNVWCCRVEKYECHYFLNGKFFEFSLRYLALKFPFLKYNNLKIYIIYSIQIPVRVTYKTQIWKKKCTVAPIHVISYSKALNPLVSQNIEGTSISRLTQTPLPVSGKKWFLYKPRQTICHFSTHTHFLRYSVSQKTLRQRIFHYAPVI